MEDLLQSQIKKSCELALPNGLKELMWDISREVLRSQPPDIYDFITKYLSVLLVTRENLSIAAKVCDETCHGPCQLMLEDELRNIGLNDGDVLTVTTIVMEHLEGTVSESNLLLKLIRTTNIDEDLLPALQKAIRAAFVQHHGQKRGLNEVPSDCEDEVREAVTHTLRLYETSSPSNEEYNRMATRIQAAYRAYGVRRSLCVKNEIRAKSFEIKDKAFKIKDVNAHVEIKEPEKIKETKNYFRASVTTESSSSLAGSYVKLPKYIPYSAHDVHDTDEEILEKVHSHAQMEDEMDEPEDLCVEKVKERKATVSFEALMIKDNILEADDESEGIVEELIAESDDLEEVLSEVNAAESDIDLVEIEECEVEENEIMSEDKYEHLNSVSYFG